MAAGTAARAIYRLDLAVDAILDLRDPTIWTALSISNAPFCFTNQTITRATARYVRDTTRATGMFVPSVAFLDQLDRWCLVLFLDKLPSDPRAYITSVTQVGTLGWPTAPR